MIAAPGAVRSERIKAQAYGLGFDLAGIAVLGPVETARYFEEWLAAGHAGEMTYLPKWADKRRDSRLPFPGASSAIVVAMNYGGTRPPGPVARYARGDDYHDVMIARLRELHRWLERELGHELLGKAYVDTGPILERDLARRAGLGWFGKNTNLLNPSLGSFFFLGALFVGEALEPDAPFEADRCGTCTRCIEACPTAAIIEPRVLDATRCISYLTIEQRGPIEPELRTAIGDLLYGCDICQDVCPWNERFSREPREPAFDARAAIAGKDARTLAREVLAMDDDAYRAAFSHSPIKRTKRRGLARNAAVVLGNIGTAEDVPALVAALAHDEPLVRDHAAWALEQIQDVLR
ncbi:MAG: tRNA epoxyqueuosine(34) reductase QueG [Gemmatimonadaceae bacterium]